MHLLPALGRAQAALLAVLPCIPRIMAGASWLLHITIQWQMMGAQWRGPACHGTTVF